MANQIFREYRFKFYLNALHYVIFDGKKGEEHPHTWEITLDILINKQTFIEFRRFETEIETFLEPYQDMILNEVAPFDKIIPTLENIVDQFSVSMSKIVRDLGARLIRIEGKETPTRGYIVDFTESDEYMNDIQDFSKEAVLDIMDSIIDECMR
ncbi:MAG: 6-carboxytetrahydropterin synthase [Lachnospiraceae bacterium]|nr:6-carboxytetrahydropterin synthase [Lachnospiraceae bacterium]